MSYSGRAPSHELLIQANEALSRRQWPVARRCYQDILRHQAYHRDAVMGLIRLSGGQDELRDLAQRLAYVVLLCPWDFAAIDLLIETDPALAGRIRDDMAIRRATTAAPAPMGMSWEMLAHHQDLRMLHEISMLPQVAHAVSQQHLRFSDAAFTRQMLLNSVRIGPAQMPKLWELHLLAAHRTGCAPLPELYVVDDPDLNAFTGGAVHCFVCLNTGLLEALTDEELLFVIGHEMGHILHRHVLHYKVAQQLAQAQFQAAANTANAAAMLTIFGGTLGSIGGNLAGAAAIGKAQEAARIVERVLRWQQYSEFSADRAGVVACQSAAVAVNALVMVGELAPKASLGARFGNGFNLDAFLEQYDEAARSFAHVAPTEDYLRSHPYVAHRIRCLQGWQLSQGYYSYVTSRIV